MTHRFKTYFESLEALSTEELDRSAEKLVRAEKKNVALVIAHLAEMSRRKGELESGYKNLFEYGVVRLGLSEGSVARRLQVANVSRRFPQILAAIADNRLSLTAAGLLAPHLNEDNVDALVSDCEGKTKRGVEAYLVAIEPKPVFKPSIRQHPSPKPEPTPRKAAPEPPPRASSPPILQPARPEVFNFRFSAGREFKDAFERLAEVLNVGNPEKNMAGLIARAFDIALDQKDPKRRLERRRAKASEKKSRPGKMSPDAPAKSRHVAAEVRERVHERGDYQCEFQAANGRRCSERTGLEIEHVDPFAVFRRHDERRLRLLCKRHNLYMAERYYGAEHIQQKIAESRRAVP